VVCIRLPAALLCHGFPGIRQLRIPFAKLSFYTRASFDPFS
jgi:hypothetical protein